MLAVLVGCFSFCGQNSGEWFMRVELIVFRVNTLQQWLGILHTVGRTNTGAILVYTEIGMVAD